MTKINLQIMVHVGRKLLCALEELKLIKVVGFNPIHYSHPHTSRLLTHPELDTTINMTRPL